MTENPENFSPLDHRFMIRAIELASRGLFTTDPNPRVGCVLVKEGQIVGEGWHQRAGGPHAEVHALMMAGPKAQGSTAYVTLEPCCHHGKTPPCSLALIEAGIQRVVAAMKDPNPAVAGKGLDALRQAGIDARSGLLGRDAERLNPGFLHRMRYGKPWVRSKLAMSLDGRTAMASGESRWITGPKSRQDVHRLRARSSAIMTGIGTVLADDPRLNARLEDAEEIRQPDRIILDSNLRAQAPLAMSATPGRCIILTCEGAPERRDLHGMEIIRLPRAPDGRLDLAAVMDWLGREAYNEILVEAGPTLNGQLLAGHWVHEWMIYMAPVVLGDQGRGLFSLEGMTRMSQRVEVEFHPPRNIGRDLLLSFTDPGAQ